MVCIHNFLHFYTALSSGHVLDLQCEHKHPLERTHTHSEIQRELSKCEFQWGLFVSFSSSIMLQIGVGRNTLCYGVSEGRRQVLLFMKKSFWSCIYCHLPVLLIDLVPCINSSSLTLLSYLNMTSLT